MYGAHTVNIDPNCDFPVKRFQALQTNLTEYHYVYKGVV